MAKPIRILQVASQMTPAHGGAEIWLMQVLRHIDRSLFRMDFVVHTTQPQPFHDEIRSLGSRLFACPRPLHLWQYPRALRRILAEHGPYDIVHTHVLFGAFVLRLARRAGVPVRIMHMHAAGGSLRGNGLLIDAFLRWTNRWLPRDASRGLAASRAAAAAAFGPHWQQDGRWSVLPCGIDLRPFHDEVIPDKVRAELGIPAGVPVIGHVGRFVREKNHALLLELARDLSQRGQDFRLLLIGDGPLRADILSHAASLGVVNKLVWLGQRNDVPRLMRGAMDLFVFPSLSEGMPLTLIEAQAAGLSCVIADVMPPEVDVVPPLIQRLPLGRPAAWAEAVLRLSTSPPLLTHEEALQRIAGSDFNITTSVKRLEGFYAEAVSRGKRTDSRPASK